MKYIFIINPKAGKKDRHIEYENSIKSYFENRDDTYEIYLTEYPNHATEIADKVCIENEYCKIFVFGGDGTFNEVISGAYGHDNFSIGVFPSGTGNDFVKTLNSFDVSEISELIEGEELCCDVMKANDQIGINICSSGFDAEVAKNVTKFKKFVSGNLAYTLSTFYCFITKTKYNFKITIDDKCFEGKYIFAIAANGRYYGGGFFPAPNAQLNDGLLDFILIKGVSRLKILNLIDLYRKGKHIGLDIVQELKGKKMTVECKKPLSLNIDGEVKTVDKIDIEVLPSKIKLIKPCHQAHDLRPLSVPQV